MFRFMLRDTKAEVHYKRRRKHVGAKDGYEKCGQRLCILCGSNKVGYFQNSIVAETSLSRAELA